MDLNNNLAALVGFEPTKSRGQSPLPYRLAIGQYRLYKHNFRLI